MDVEGYIQERRAAAESIGKRILDYSIFYFNHVPRKPLIRAEAKRIIDILVRYRETGISRNLIIIGSRGSGKTLMLKYLAGILSRRLELPFHYVNCRFSNTSFKILAKILGVKPRGYSYDELCDQFEARITGRRVIVLDEVDLMADKDFRKDILYFLSRSANRFPWYSSATTRALCAIHAKDGVVEGYITVGLYDDGTPAEVFLVLAKAGESLRGLARCWAICLSLCLQMGVPLGHLVEKFAFFRFEPSGLTTTPEIPIAQSIADYTAKWLELTFLKEKGSSEAEGNAVAATGTPAPLSAATVNAAACASEARDQHHRSARDIQEHDNEHNQRTN